MATSSPASLSNPTRQPVMITDGALGQAQKLAESYLGLLRRRHPVATPAQILHVLNKQYLLAMALGGTGTGLVSLRARTTLPLLSLSAAHAGVSGIISAFYLLARASLYGLGPAETRRLVATCSLGESRGGILEQQAAGTWWRSAVAYLPASQVHLVRGISERALKRPAREGHLSATAKALPAGIGSTVGFGSGRILGNRVIAAAATHMGSAPRKFD